MEQTSNRFLKTQFREAFPEYASRMESAKNQQEAEETYNEIIGECFKNLQKANSNGMLKSGNEGIEVAICQKDYERMIQSTGDDIEYRVTKLLNAFSAAKQAMDTQDHETATASLLAGGVLAVGAESISMCYTALKAGATTYAAALKAVTSCWGGVVALVSFVVTLVLIPILYFMEKPAAAVMLLLNETDETILMRDKDNKHGKQLTITKEIGTVESGQPGCLAGVFISSKKDKALVGTSTGYHFQLEDSKEDFYFGVECPLTSLYGDNNCACDIEGSSEKIADKTHSKNVQEDSCVNGKYTCSIRCSNKGGSIAYYIARIHK